MSCPPAAMSSLEPELRSRGESEVMVGAIIEIHFVASLNSNSEPPDEAFQSAAGVEHTVGVATGNPVKCSLDGVAPVEIEEAAL